MKSTVTLNLFQGLILVLDKLENLKSKYIYAFIFEIVLMTLAKRYNCPLRLKTDY